MLCPEDLRRSLEYFEAAIAADRKSAPAYAGLADAYTLLVAVLLSPPFIFAVQRANNDLVIFALLGAAAFGVVAAGNATSRFISWDGATIPRSPGLPCASASASRM